MGIRIDLQAFPTYLLVVTCIVVTFTALPSQHCIAQQPQYQYQDEFPVRCRKSINGQMENVFFGVDLENPDKGDTTGWGVARFVPAELSTHAQSTLTNCNDDGVAHMEVVEFDENWTQIQVVQGQQYVFSHADNKRYWDWYYEEYIKPDKCDYFQNCHGYAFGKGKWPMNAVLLLNMGPFPSPAPPGLNVNPCFEAAEKIDAEIAVDPLKHSIKVEGTECEHVPDEGPIPNPLPIIQVIHKSWEQFRESGIYRQEKTCPDEVNLKEADQEEHQGLSLTLVKKKT